MVKRILNFLRTDLHWILIASGLSVVLWLVSMAVLDPERNEPYRRPLFFDNLAILDNEDLMILDGYALPDEIIVGVRAPASLHTILAEAEIRPSIDFRAVDARRVHSADGPVAMTLRVGVDVPYGFTVLHMTPAEVTVMLDARVRETFPVQLIETGEPAANTELQRVTLANPSVTLTGPRSVVDRGTVRVEAHVNLTGLAETTTYTVRLVALDAFDNDISDHVIFNISETTATIEILPVKRVPVTVLITGELAEGFAVAGYETSLDYVYITGPAEALADIDALAPDFNLEHAYADIDRVLTIADYLPPGVHPARGALTGLYVRVVVEPIQERIFTILRGSIGVFGGAHYTILGDPTHVIVRVSGPRSIISQLTAAQIGVQLNLHDRGVGTHQVALQIILPPGLQTVGEIPILEIQINEPPPAEEPDPDPPEEPEPNTPPEPTPTPPPNPEPDPPPPPDDGTDEANEANDNGAPPYEEPPEENPDPPEGD